MLHPVSAELDAFLEAHPDIRFFDAFVADLDATEHGRRLDGAAIRTVFESGMPLPGSILVPEADGRAREPADPGFDDGDADRPCRPVPHSLVPVPWLQADGVAQLQLSMYETDGRPFFADPRQVLARVLDRFHRLNLTPCLGLGYPFQLVGREHRPGGLPGSPARTAGGRRTLDKHFSSTIETTDHAAVLSAIQAACRTQGVPASAPRPGRGTGQFEVELASQPDALAVCDQALRFRRLVRQVARAQGLDASFAAQPRRPLAGPRLQVHASLRDAGGDDLFAAGGLAGSAHLRHAIRGLLDTMVEGMAICVPGPDAYRRAPPGAGPALTAAGSVDGRGAVLHVPADDGGHRRIEHRLATADANPYLAVAWVLAGIHRGLSRGEEPPPALDGHTGRFYGGAPPPLHWPAALERFAASSFAAEYLGGPFTRAYEALRRGQHGHSTGPD
ncbi:MAG: glutamine synthetase family protein [Steroidobacteraceae bacterium]|jgi:glutamine synthetase|nr:glutamine synthetase family protein [Steroidobacteraceae bacterium]